MGIEARTMEKPHRAHEFICIAAGDTRERLADELRSLADRLERGEITSEGCVGGSSAGSQYSYKHDPEMTHAKYFENINAWLKTSTSGD